MSLQHSFGSTLLLWPCTLFFPCTITKTSFASLRSVAGSNNTNFVIGSTLRSLLDGRRISGSPTTVPHF